jgi:hypothetical protein
MSAALCLRAGLPCGAGPLSADDYQRAEDRYDAGGAGAVEIALNILGIIGAPDPRTDRARILAAFSSATGTDVLTGAINQSFMTGYRSSPDTTRGWVVEREVADFRENRRIRAGVEALHALPRGGTPDHVALDLGSGAETYHAHRFARQFVVDEQDLADDIEPILAPAVLLGRGALRLKLDLIYSVLLANAALADGVALFHSDHGNLRTTAALATATLDTALADLHLQTENSAPVDVTPRFVLVPPALTGLARRLAREMAVPGAEPLTVRAEPRLSLGVTDPVTATAHAGSATTWYVTSGGGVPTIEFGYRTPQPVVARYDLPPGQWGFGIGITWDVGAKALDFRAMQKNTA